MAASCSTENPSYLHKVTHAKCVFQTLCATPMLHGNVSEHFKSNHSSILQGKTAPPRVPTHIPFGLWLYPSNQTTPPNYFSTQLKLGLKWEYLYSLEVSLCLVQIKVFLRLTPFLNLSVRIAPLGKQLSPLQTCSIAAFKAVNIPHNISHHHPL